MPVLITDGTTCESNNLTVISTASECQEAARKLGAFRVEETAQHLLPYCGYFTDRGVYNFDTTGMTEGEGIHTCSETHRCVCKNGARTLSPPAYTYTHREGYMDIWKDR